MEGVPQRQGGLFYINGEGEKIFVNPVSQGVLGNTPELQTDLRKAPYPQKRGVVEAQIDNEPDLVKNGIASIQNNY